jgi:hypothetical protein
LIFSLKTLFSFDCSHSNYFFFIFSLVLVLLSVIKPVFHQLLVAKTAKKPLKCAIVQRSGTLFMAYAGIFSKVVAKLCCATLNFIGILLCYAALTAMVSVLTGPWSEIAELQI